MAHLSNSPIKIKCLIRTQGKKHRRSFYLYKRSFDYGQRLCLLYPEAGLCPLGTNAHPPSLFPSASAFASYSQPCVPLRQLNLLCSENLVVRVLSQYFPFLKQDCTPALILLHKNSADRKVVRMTRNLWETQMKQSTLS